MIDPALIRTPADLESQIVLCSTQEETLKLAFLLDFGFDLHWLRDTGQGILAGDFGMSVDAGRPASARCELAGGFRRVISLDANRRLRLRVFPQVLSGLCFPSRLSVAVHGQLPQPGEIDELVAALIGIHERQRPSPAPASSSSHPPRRALKEALHSLDGFLDLDQWTRSRLEDLFGPIRSEDDLALAERRLQVVLNLRDSIYSKATGSLERKLAAELSSACHSAGSPKPLVDFCFDFSEEGLHNYRQALLGDCHCLSPCSGKCLPAFSKILGRRLRLELHLPMMGRREWSSRLQAMSGLEVDCDEGGRLFSLQRGVTGTVAGRNHYLFHLALGTALAAEPVHSEGRYSLSWSDCRTLHPAQIRATLVPAIGGYGFGDDLEKWLEAIPLDGGDIQVSLDVSIPCALAKAWLEAPRDNSPDYHRVYSRVSLAVQQVLRRWLPYCFFDDLRWYSRLGPALPLLVYQLSRPLVARPKADLTYDVWSDVSLQKLMRSASGRMGQTLSRLGRLLAAPKMEQRAGYYAAKHARRVLASVSRSRNFLRSLLAAESILVNALVKFGCASDVVRSELARDRKTAARLLARLVDDLTRTFQGRLRLLYAARDFQSLGTLLLLEATHSLHVAKGGEPSLRAVLRLRRGEPGRQGSLDVTFVNSRASTHSPAAGIDGGRQAACPPPVKTGSVAKTALAATKTKKAGVHASFAAGKGVAG